MTSTKFSIGVGNRIKLIREESGKTQDEIAKKAGMNTNYFAVIERGEVTTSSEKLQKIANALGVEVSKITNY